MEQTKEIYDIATHVGKKRKTEKKGIPLYSVIIRTIGILLARAIPISGFAPFGISFLAMERRFSNGAVISALMVGLGYVSLFEPTLAIKYIFAILIYLTLLFAQKNTGFDISPVMAVCASGISVVVGNIAEMAWFGFSAGGILWLLCDVAMTVLGTITFERCRGLLKGKRGNLFSMNGEERMCVGFLASIAIIGFKSIAVSEFFYASNIVGLWLIAVISLCGGAPVSTLCGAIIGVLTGIGGNLVESIAVFTICGAAGGILSRYGKTAVCIAVSTAAVLCALYCGELGYIIFGYMDIPASALLILLTTESLIRRIGIIAGVGTEKTDEEECKDFVKSRLNSAAESFRVLAKTFFDISDKQNSVDMEEVSMMFDGTADRVCKECSRVCECWVTGFNSTYKAMFHMLEIMERKGELREEDADEYFSRRCLRLRAVVREMNRLFEIYKINCVWKSKLAENRELAGQQLGSVAQILDSIADDLYEEQLDSGAEEEIRIRMEAKGIEVTRLNVTIDNKGRYTGYVGAVGNVSELRRGAELALKAVLGVKLVEIGETKMADGSFMMRFAQPEGYKIEYGLASKGKDEESGDNSVLRYLSDGKFAAAISDGMGTGHRAARDSGATVTLLGDFLEAGFDKTVAVRLVNSIMVMKSASEAFATVDMCVIDLYSGETEFVKNGAEPSYIKRGEQTEVVRSASLPVGVVRDMEVESFARHVKSGDLIIMTSDGLQMKKGHDEWIKKMVESAENDMPPQELAERIMEMAVALRGGNAEDDMTVVVMKICEAE